jgi:ubiquinone/menaquinone biosynthesis C-methylase UbiE
MIKDRVVETNEGIQGEVTVELFDRFAKGMRDRGFHPIQQIIQSGINAGRAMEVGPGPGYVGLEWLKKCSGAFLTGLEISPDMVRLARKNANDYGLTDQTEYVLGSCLELPFPDGQFDAAFSSGSLHEWEDPVRALKETHRVLKPGGRLFINDMRRDVSPFIKWPIYFTTRPREIKWGFKTSLAASYTVPELEAIALLAGLRNAEVKPDFFGLTLTFVKP